MSVRQSIEQNAANVESVHRAWDEMRQTLMRLRLHGSPWWRDEWDVAKLSHDALNATDLAGDTLETLLPRDAS